MFYTIALIIMYLPLILFFPTKIINRHKLPKGKSIVTSNHYSNLDPMIMVVGFRRKFRFVAKKELLKNKFSAMIMRGLKAIPVDRESVAPSTFKEVLKNLKEERSVFIFPEGTRNKTGEDKLQDVKNGVITFASKGEAEIVPMLIYRKPKFLRKNYIIVGDPIKIEGENPKKLTKEEQEANLNRYVEAMNALRVELDEYVANKKRKKRNS